MQVRLALVVPVHPGKVVGSSGQSEFCSNLGQSATTEGTHSALLFQDPEDRFDLAFTPGIHASSFWVRILCRIPHVSLNQQAPISGFGLDVTSS